MNRKCLGGWLSRWSRKGNLLIEKQTSPESRRNLPTGRDDRLLGLKWDRQKFNQFHSIFVEKCENSLNMVFVKFHAGLIKVLSHLQFSEFGAIRDWRFNIVDFFLFGSVSIDTALCQSTKHLKQMPHDRNGWTEYQCEAVWGRRRAWWERDNVRFSASSNYLNNMFSILQIRVFLIWLTWALLRGD